jgi:hypothetical protein
MIDSRPQVKQAVVMAYLRRLGVFNKARRSWPGGQPRTTGGALL